MTVYGAPENAAEEKGKPGALKSSLLELTLTCPQKSDKKIKKKLPGNYLIIDAMQVFPFIKQNFLLKDILSKPKV